MYVAARSRAATSRAARGGGAARRRAPPARARPRGTAASAGAGQVGGGEEEDEGRASRGGSAEALASQEEIEAPSSSGEDRARDLQLLLRRHAARPYPCRGECGRSRAVKRLRDARHAASRDAAARHVLIVGEPGTLKSDVALLIHAGDSVRHDAETLPRRRRPAAALDCGRLRAFESKAASTRAQATPLQTSAAAFADTARRKEKRAATLIADLIEALSSIDGGGTLILRDVHVLPAGAASVVASAMRAPAGAHGVRLILTASKPVPELMPPNESESVITVRVPPLRVRREDIEAEALFFLRTAAVRADQPSTMPRGITEAGVRQLQAHDWPGNETELEALIERAAVQQFASDALLLKRQGARVAGNSPPATPPGPPPMLSESVLWPDPRASRGESFRFDLLRAYPLLRKVFRSELWPDGFMRYVVVPVFAVWNLGLLFGPQARDDNVFLTVFWAWWWPGILLVYPLVGRLWCSFCPFMAYGELVQRWRLATGARLRRWPSDALDRYGAWFLYALFAAILVWEEVWALEDHARLSSALLLLITAGAVAGSAMFEKRVWCRYLCPIGGMNGLFAKLAVTEVRAERGICSATCTTYGCYKGSPPVRSHSPSLDDGLATDGCPLGVHPAQLLDNRNCVGCGVCIKACPHGSVTVNLRPPGIDLLTTHEATPAEASLLFLLLGAVFVHRGVPAAAEALLQGSPADGLLGAALGNFHVTAAGLGEALATCAQEASSTSAVGAHALATVALLAYPGALALGAHALACAVPRAPGSGGTWARPQFVREAYAYLPLTWLASLAHYLDLGMGEAGQVLPRAARTVGLTGLAEGGALPALVADPAVISFCQGASLAAGSLLSLALLRALARRPWPALWPQSAAVALLTAQLWALIV